MCKETQGVYTLRMADRPISRCSGHAWRSVDKSRPKWLRGHADLCLTRDASEGILHKA